MAIFNLDYLKHLIKIAILFAFFLFVSLPFKEVNGQENNLESSTFNLIEVFQTIKINSPDSIKIERKKLQIIHKAHKNGFISASIDSIKASNKSTLLYVYLGNKYYLKHIFISPSLDIKKSNYRINNNKVKPYEINRIKNIETKLKHSFENEGFAFVKIEKKTEINKTFEIIHNWKILPGQYYTFENIQIDSLHNLELKFLKGISGIKKDRKYQKKLVDSFESRINNSEIFKVDSFFVAYGHNTVKIIPYIKKIKNNNLSGFVGIQTSENEKTTITGQVQLSTKNILKTGEKINLEWNKPKSKSQFIDAATTFPYLFGLPFGFSGQIIIDKRDSTFLNQSSKAGIIFHAIPQIEITGYYSTANSTTLQSTESEHTAKQQTYGLGIKTNLLNNLTFPTKGFSSLIDAQIGNRRAYSKQTISILQLKINAYIPIAFGSFVINNTSGIILSDSITTYEYFQLGGIKNMRGFNEKSIFSKQYSISNFEYRIKLAQNSYIIVFYDFGLFSPSNNYNFDKRHAIGVGINLSTNAGVLNISYGLGKINNKPFNINSGKIHIGYITNF